MTYIGGIKGLAGEWNRDRYMDSVWFDEEPTREGVPLSQWRSLPDSPTADPELVGLPANKVGAASVASLIAFEAFTATDPESGAEIEIPRGTRTEVDSAIALAYPDRWTTAPQQ